MRPTPLKPLRTLLRYRASNLLLIILTGCLAWLSNQYGVSWDMTRQNRHSLSPASLSVLQTLTGPVTVQAFIPESSTLQRQHIRHLVSQYQKHFPGMTLEFSDPASQPDVVQDRGINPRGALLISSGSQEEKIERFTEATISNALQRLSGPTDRWILFLDGHGERSPFGVANHDYGQFGEILKDKGFRVQQINLARLPDIPDNTSLLVISHPAVNPLDQEQQLLRAYVKRGGNLLWLNDPAGRDDYPMLARDLGIRFLPGITVDATSQQYGINDPSFVVVTEYPEHPASNALRSLTLLPQSLAILGESAKAYTPLPIIMTQLSSWTETAPLTGQIEFNPGTNEFRGPLILGQSLTRSLPGEEFQQRIAVFGDGDFIANAYVGNGSNLDFGINLLQWLTGEDRQLDIPARTAADLQLQLTELETAIIGFGFLVVLPLSLVLCGTLIWRHRRRI